MVREFSEEKRDEIFRALDAIDNREWKSFMAWCGGRASEFGDWPDRIELRTHTNYVDDYHQKILDINEMTRNQVNAVFEHVAEIDTRYAGLMKECQEEIKEQIATVHTMIEFMRPMNGGNINTNILKENINKDGVKLAKDINGEERKNVKQIDITGTGDLAELSYEESQMVLMRFLTDHNILEQEEIIRIVAWVMANLFTLVQNLCFAYFTGSYNGQDAETIYEIIMKNYNDYQGRLARDYFLTYVEKYGLKDSNDWEEMALILQEVNPKRLMNLCETYGDEGKAAVFHSLLEIYDEYIYNEKLLDAQALFRKFIAKYSTEDKGNWSRIVDIVRNHNPDLLINLYDTNGIDGKLAIFNSLMEIYDRYKLEITIDDLESLDMGEPMNPMQKETFVACWNMLVDMGVPEMHIIAVMANIYAESKFSAQNAQDSYGYDNKEYVDGDYEYVSDDGVGYGILQWTLLARKEALEAFALDTKGSVYSLETQLDYFRYEMENEDGICATEWRTFLGKGTLEEAVFYFMDVIENPKENNTDTRNNYAYSIQEWYSGL